MANENSLNKMTEESAQSLSAAASLEHLTGPSRSTVSWLNASSLGIHLTAKNVVEVSDIEPSSQVPYSTVRLFRSKGSYELEVPDDQIVWVNGKPVRHALLVNGDIIEFGENGPLSRFHLHRDGRGGKQTVTSILHDCFDYLHVSRQPIAKRLWRATTTLLRRLSRETTLLFRISVVGAITLLIGFAYQQNQLSRHLETVLQSSTERLEHVSAVLARARRDALHAGDLEVLRDEMAQRLVSQTARLKALEERSGASARIIANSATSVAFLQGAYGYQDKKSGRFLRHVLDASNQPIITPFGQPKLSLDGDGPTVEIQYTGTGFAIAGSPVLVTNRHVALPWEGASAAAGGDLEPVMHRFQAYFSGRSEPKEIKLIKASEKADLALLRILDVSEMDTIGLKLSEAPPNSGDEVIVMGYPTGLRSLLARTGEAFIEELQSTGETDFWKISKRLAAEGYIAPLASRGIVGQATHAAVVYDAETTHGGSGGPVLDIRGHIVAVNAAILPEYGGSNFGVPVAFLKELLSDSGFN